MCEHALERPAQRRGLGLPRLRWHLYRQRWFKLICPDNYVQEEAINVMAPPLLANGLWNASRHWINVFPGNVLSTAFDYFGANKVFHLCLFRWYRHCLLYT